MIGPDRPNRHEIRNSVEEKERKHKRMVNIGDPLTKILQTSERNFEAGHYSYRSKRSINRVGHVTDKVLKMRHIYSSYVYEKNI